MADNNAGGVKKDMSGYLYPNKQKKTEKQPDMRGKLTINGKEYLFSGWRRMKDGEEMITVSLTDPDTLPAKGVANNSSKVEAGNFTRTTPAPAQNKASSGGFKTGDGQSDGGYTDLDGLDDLFEGFDK